MNPQPGPDHFSPESYDTKERFISYWHQIHEIISLGPKTVLDVDIGNGFVTRYLREKGWDVTTLDIVSELRPDVAGSVLSLTFAQSSRLQIWLSWRAASSGGTTVRAFIATKGFALKI